ncbi:MAG: hypothetical protein RL318_1313 [Fibrobacterota bacterium]|jgi:RluA family pseudouridine synthase
MALLPGDDGPYIFTSILPASAQGKALLDHLQASFGYHPRETWQERILAGAVSVAGDVWFDPSARLVAGQVLAYNHGEYQEPDVPTNWRVVDRGDDWMAIDKPSGQPIHSTSRIFRQTLVWQVRKLHGADWSPCHRLDRDTSGLVLFARTHAALSWLQRSFEHRQVRKEYLACLRGELTQPVTVEGAIGPEVGSMIRSRLCVVPDEPSAGGKPSRTEFVPIRWDDALQGTWCRVHPLQGRRHQIRVHAQHIGHPLVGDPLYDGQGGIGYLARVDGKDAQEVARLSGGSRLWLHSCSLEFLDTAPPGLPRSVRAPLPDGFDN